jgi:hypothetical protein
MERCESTVAGAMRNCKRGAAWVLARDAFVAQRRSSFLAGVRMGFGRRSFLLLCRAWLEQTSFLEILRRPDEVVWCNARNDDLL